MAGGFSFPWLFLILLLVSATVAVIFLFYFNRVFGWLVSAFLRLYLRVWTQWEVYIDIESIQISLLAGRVFFGKIVYHGTNESIIVINSHITWRYWYRKVRESLGNDGEDETDPCRVLVHANGVEWYIYNRTAAYDNIIAEMSNGNNTSNMAGSALNDNGLVQKLSSSEVRSSKDESGLRDRRSRSLGGSKDLGESGRKSTSDYIRTLPKLTPAEVMMLNILPVQLEVDKGAVVLGNSHTPSVMIAQFAKARGSINAFKSKYNDKFKQSYKVKFEDATVHIKDNDEYTEGILERGEKLFAKTRERFQFATFWTSIRNFVPDLLSDKEEQSSEKAKPDPEKEWAGLSRYTQDDASYVDGEYARVTEILKSPVLTLDYYYDSPGFVTQESTTAELPDNFKDINGDSAPEYGLDMIIEGGTVNYGPWADRHRYQLQSMFFPRLYKNALPSKRIRVGQTRVFTQFNIYVEITQKTVLQIPTKEFSKDWKYKGSMDKRRLPGSLELTVLSNSTISYSMGMVPLREKWVNKLNVDLKYPELRTSVNHGLLFKADVQKVTGDLSNPLVWNAFHKWTFESISQDIKLFLLREHIILLTDLIGDWTSGPPADHATFVPFQYSIKLQFLNIELPLNVNDGNIIDDPSDYNNNLFLIGKTRELQASFEIPLERFRPAFNSIPFKISVTEAVLDLHMPRWNTRFSFIDTNEIAVVRNVMLSGEYHYASGTGPDLVDTLTLDANGKYLLLRLDGYLIRYFLTLQKNYFGENLHFKTFNEHHSTAQRVKTAETLDTPVPVSDHQVHATKSNDIDVLLTVGFSNNNILLPSNIYSAKSHVALEVPDIAIDMRFTNYYMDLQVDVSPATATLGTFSTTILDAVKVLPVQLFVDGIVIYGHRLFGLPPNEPTYVCNWDLNIGAVDGDCTHEFLRVLLQSLKTFAFGAEDVENALALEAATVHDATFLRLKVKSARVAVQSGSSLLLFKSDEVKLGFNDLADMLFSEKVSLHIPNVSISCLDVDNSRRGGHARFDAVETHAYLETSCQLNVFNTRKHLSRKRMYQQRHIHEHDQPTKRAQFLLWNHFESPTSSLFEGEQGMPSIPIPSVPQPLQHYDRLPSGSSFDSQSRVTGASSRRTASTAKKSSFLSSSFRSSRSNHSGDSSSSFHSALTNQDKDQTYKNLAYSGYNLSTPSRELITAKDAPELKRYASSGVIFSSKLVRPSFSMDGIEPDTDDAPRFPEPKKTAGDDSFEPYSESTSREDGQFSALLEFTPGIRGFCNVKALARISELLENLQCKTVEDVLDNLQMSVVGQLAGIKKARKKVRDHRTFNLFVKIPFVGLRIFFPVPHQIYASHSSSYAEALEITFENAQIAARSRDISSRTPDQLHTESTTVLSAHLQIDNASLSLSHTGPIGTPRLLRNSLQLVLHDILFWTSSNKSATASLNLKLASLLFNSAELANFLDFVDRAGSYFTDFAHKCSEISAEEKRHIKHIVYQLVLAGEEDKNHDPPLLINNWNVLRSSLDHVRINDSWKIMGRVRHIYKMQSPSKQSLMDLHCRNKAPDLDQNARVTVAKALERWRHGELGKDLITGYFMQKVFRTKPKPEAAPFNGKITLHVEQATFQVDIKPAQKISWHNLILAGNVGLPAAGSSDTIKVFLQTHCDSVVSESHWDLLKIAEDVHEYITSERGVFSQRPPRQKESSKKREPKQSKFPKFELHFVFTAHTGSAVIETPNLRIMSMLHNFQATFFATSDSPTENRSLLMSSLLEVEAGSSEICSQPEPTNQVESKVLAYTNMRQGSLNVNYLNCKSETSTANQLAVLADCGTFSVDAREHILGLIDFADKLVRNEFSDLNELNRKLKRPDSLGTLSPPRRNSVRSIQNRKTDSTEFTAEVVLNLGQFTCCVTLLPSLAYLIRGKGIQLTARPKGPKDTIIDVDIDQHEHEVRTSDAPEVRSISILNMPQINARVRHRNSPMERLIEAYLSVEAITLEASAIQSLLNALNKPEIANVVEEARNEWNMLTGHVKEIFGKLPSRRTIRRRTGPNLAYRVNLGIAGLKILTEAPTAVLEINLGSVQLRAKNKASENAPILPLPEISVELQKITSHLSRTTLSDISETCGYIELQASLLCSSQLLENGRWARTYHVKTNAFHVDVYTDTAVTVIEIIGHLQDKLRDLDLSKEMKQLRKQRQKPETQRVDPFDKGIELLSSIFSIEMQGIQWTWVVDKKGPFPSGYTPQDLVLTLKRISLATDVVNQGEARLAFEDFAVQLVEENRRVVDRSSNSALMPQVVFKVRYSADDAGRHLKFQATGHSLDLRMMSSCVVPLKFLEKSMARASERFRSAAARLKSKPTSTGKERTNLFGSKRLASLLVDADFQGAVVYLQNASDHSMVVGGVRIPQLGQSSHFSQVDTSRTVLRSPGLAFKIEYNDPIYEDPSINGEIQVSASQNVLYPAVVSMILEMMNSVKDLVQDDKKASDSPEVLEKSLKKATLEDPPITPDPAAILGTIRLNVGLRIRTQEFSLSCQPIARVTATAKYKDIYIAVNTCEDPVSGRFYTLSATVDGLSCSLQHVYSRESTGRVEVEQLVLSLMNSRHIGGSSGISCSVKMSPVNAQVNIKQIQDFLLFREIWIPAEIRNKADMSADGASDTPTQLVQRYHKVAATNAFPWNTSVTFVSLNLQLDLGPALGRSAFNITNLWVSSKKTSDWMQTMCLGFDKVSITSTGRLGGLIELVDFRARTSIQWGSSEDKLQTPLIEAALGFDQFRAKVAFEYQEVLVADIAQFDFLMYNLRQSTETSSDQLVGILNGDKVQVFCTAYSAAQIFALYQAFTKLSQEKVASFETSLRDVEKFLTRRSNSYSNIFQTSPTSEDTEIRIVPPISKHEEPDKLSLHTNVIVHLKEVNIGAFPSTFNDSQVFKLEASEMGAHFFVEMTNNKLHSQLGMTLGQLRIALSSVKKLESIGASNEFTVEEVVTNVRDSRGGTILKVPHVQATMHTWHVSRSNDIDYTFRSAFEGRVDVGWNYARISFIRSMWAKGVEALTQRQGRVPSSPATISINATNLSPSTASFPESISAQSEAGTEAGTWKDLLVTSGSDEAEKDKDDKPKITAVVNVPQSRYNYRPLEPPVVETPLLRDMGEATPPLEWIGLNRDRLPNLTHQIVIVSLLEVAKEVEDAYFKILGG